MSNNVGTLFGSDPTSGGGAALNQELWVYNATNASGGNDSVTFASTQLSTGTNITYLRDAVNGDKFTLTVGGIYAASLTYSSNTGVFGITYNIYATSGILALTAAQVLCLGGGDALASGPGNCSITMRFAAGDFITVGNQLAGLGSASGLMNMHITMVGT